MSAGRPINQQAIDALRRSDMRTLGHAEASEALKVNFGIIVSRQGVGRLRRVYGIKWANHKCVAVRIRSLMVSGKVPDKETILSDFKVSNSYANRLLIGNF